MWIIKGYCLGWKDALRRIVGYVLPVFLLFVIIIMGVVFVFGGKYEDPRAVWEKKLKDCKEGRLAADYITNPYDPGYGDIYKCE